MALGFVLLTGGDARGAILGATNYGRDSDSIATMGGAICGALNGRAGVPQDWVDQVAEASRLDLQAGGLTMAELAVEVHRRDLEREDAARAAFATLTDTDATAAAAR